MNRLITCLLCSTLLVNFGACAADDDEENINTTEHALEAEMLGCPPGTLLGCFSDSECSNGEYCKHKQLECGGFCEKKSN